MKRVIHSISGNKRAADGFTLIELVASVGVFMVVVGASSQVLVNFYTAMDVTEQKAAATQNCVNVLNQLRGLRSQSDFVYPTSFTDAFAPGAIIQDTAETLPADRRTTLPNETITVQYATTAGTILNAAGVANASLVQVIVTSQWQTRKSGQLGRVIVSTLLSNS